MKTIQQIMMLILFISSLSLATTIKTWKKNYPTGNSAWIKLENKPNNYQDWVGIYPIGANTDWKNVVQWKWAREPSPATDPGDWYEFPKLADGNYEARFFLNNTYLADKSIAFSVGKTTSISTSKVNYALNENIRVNIENQAKYSKNWIGIYPKGASNDWANVVVWEWTYGENSVLLDGIAKGDYEARLFYKNSFTLEAKTEFSVENKIYPPETTLTKKIVNRVKRPAQKFLSYTDNAFDNRVTRTVTRLTNREKDKKGSNSHQYPKQGSAWNSDMSLLRISQRVYDAKTLKELPITKDKNADQIMLAPQSGASGIRWSKHNPNILYVMSGDNKFYELTINKSRTAVTKKVIYDLSLTGKAHFNIGHNEGNIDYADRYVVLSSTSANSIYAVLLDIKEKHLVWGPKKMQYPATNGFDWISISPSGKYILVASKQGIDLHDAPTFNLIKAKLATSAEHGDMGKTANNEDIYVQWEQTGYNGYILKNQQKRILLDFKVGGAHVSCRNYKLKNWCYVSPTDHGYREVFALKLDGSMKVRRFAKTYARGKEDPRIGKGSHYHYSRLPTGVPSPDGTRVLFWSDYGNPEKYLYYYKQNGDWMTTEHYYARDTYQVVISR